MPSELFVADPAASITSIAVSEVYYRSASPSLDQVQACHSSTSS